MLRCRRRDAIGDFLLVVWMSSLLTACAAESPGTRASLAEAAPKRSLEPRLSIEQEWQPCERRGSESRLISEPHCGPATAGDAAARRKLVRAVATIRSRTASEAVAPADLHSAALAHLVAEGSSRDAAERAVHKLETARQIGPPTAGLLTDLAAAYLVRAQRNSDPADLVRSLASADAALHQNPRYPQALFNRALVLTYLELRRPAIDGWERYLAVDAESKWAGEARSLLSTLTEPTLADGWPRRQSELKRRLYEGAGSGGLVEDYTQQVRVFLEDEAFGEWGAAVERGDPMAAKMLSFLEQASRELSRRQGDELLLAAVRRAQGASARDLAEAHRLYADARRLIADLRYSEADESFARSAELLDRHESAFAFWPHFYRAVILHHQEHFERSLTRFRELGEDTRFDQPIAHGYVAWMEGLSLFRAGHFGPARKAFQDARELFDQAGEIENRAAMDVQLAWVADEIGEPGESWRFRFLALRDLPRTVKLRRILNTLSTAARQITAEGQHQVALYFHTEHAIAAEAADDGLSPALARGERADALLRVGRSSEAAADLEIAEGLVRTLADPGVRADAEAEIALIRAKYLVRVRPESALRVLDEVAGFARSRGEDRMLIEQHRVRAQAYRSLHDPTATERELFAALQQIEKQRARLADPSRRRAYLDQARTVSEELVAHLFDSGRAAQAFEVLERARAPVLREAAPWASETSSLRSIEQMQAALPARRAIVSYLVLEDRVLGWALQKHALTPFVLDLGADELTSSITRWTEELRSARGAGPLPIPSATLLPVQGMRWTNVESLVVIPDGPLYFVPFPALPDPTGEGILLENRTASIVPSANFHLDLMQRHVAPATPPGSILVVADVPTSRRFPELPPVRPRAGLASLHELFPTVEILRGAAATERRLLAELPSYEVIEFGGHAITGSGSAWSSEVGLVLAESNGSGDGWLTPDEIQLIGQPRTRVVILAGCRTAAGRGSASEGVIGLARPLLAAGVQSVVTTLWPLSDFEAGDLVDRLTNALAQGDPAALRRAQLQQLRRTQTSGSGAHTWAGFVVWGEPL